MQQKRAKQLLEGNVPFLLFSFSLPAMVGMVAQALYNIIDRVFVGHALGSNAIAGTTVSFPFMAIIMAFGMLIGIGSAALVSMRLGEGKNEEAQRILGNASMLLICIALLVTSLGTLFLDPLLILFGASPTVLPYAHDYMQIIVYGSVFQTLGFGLNALIRAEGNPRMSMITMLISVMLNAILAPIFIFGLNWGMKGAALATVLAQAVSAIWVVCYFTLNKSSVPFHFKNMLLRRSICLKILLVGSPPFVMHMAASVTNSLLNHQLYKQGGDLAISVMGVIFAFSMFICMPVFGINQGAQPIIGFNYGAKKFDRVKLALKSAILGASTITCLGFMAAVFLPTQVFRLFNDQDAGLISMGSHAMRIALFMLPLAGFQIVSTSYFQAIGKAHIAMLLSLSRQVLLLIPVLLILTKFMGLDGVWFALPTADCLAALWSGLWLAWELKKLTEKQVLEPLVAMR